MVCVFLKEYSEKRKLEQCSLNNTKKLIIKDKTINAKVIDVYDGDTITVAFFLGNEIFQHKLRIYGIDCAEIRTKNLKEKKIAKQTKTVVEQLCFNNLVKIDCKGWDKYGRLMGTVRKGKIDIGQYLLDRGLAYPYNGKKKQKFNEWYRE